MKARISHLFGLLVLLTSSLATAQVGFSPQYFDLSQAEAEGTHAYRLFNLTPDAKQVKVSVVSWDFDDHGEVRILPSTDTSLDQWVVVNPVEFTIPPSESQAVRFSIRPAVALADGEHRTMLIFDEIPQAQVAPAASAAGAQTALRARFQFRSAIYLQAGQVSRRAEITSASADATTLHVQATARGSANTRLDGQFMIWKAAAFPGLDHVALLGNPADEKPELPAGMLAAGRLPGQPVLPGSSHKYEIALDTTLAKGRYVAVLLGHLGDDVLSRQFAFDVPGH